MQPIHQLLSRIRWDPAFGSAQFRLGYYDRVEDRVLVVPLQAIDFDPDNRFHLQLYDQAGQLHSIPLHRIRQVFRDGELIWQRPPPDPGPPPTEGR